MTWLAASAAGLAGLYAGAFASRVVSTPLLRRASIALTALLFAGSTLTVGLHPRLLLVLPFCVLAVVLSAIDAERRLIPNVIVLPAAAIALLVRTALDPTPRWAIAGFAAFAAFAAVALVRSSGIGMGDAKLALLLGVVLGPSVVAAIAIAFFATLPVSIAVLAKHGRSGLRLTLPFAPFLTAGGLVVLLAT